MTQTTVPTSRPTQRLDLGRSAAGRPHWRWQHYLALVAIVYLAWEAWTLVAWLADGPYQITAFRDSGSLAWRMARVYEAIAIAMGIGVGTFVVRQVRRERRLTFDAMMCIAGALVYWQDPLANFYQSIFTYSSNWVNLVNWCSNTPLVANPDCGRTVEPVLFLGLFYSFGFLFAALIGGWVMRTVRRRWPGISTGRMIIVIGCVGMLFDMALEIPMTHLQLWAYPGYPDWIGTENHRYPLFVMVGAFYFFGGLTVMRNFRNDKGQTVFERGLDHIKPGRRTWLVLLSVIGFVQLFVTTTNMFFMMAAGPFADPSPNYAPHVINGLCDQSGFENTRYGPCPGTPGYRAPIRKLPGEGPPAGARAEDFYTR
jgi:hypothetical protein